MAVPKPVRPRCWLVIPAAGSGSRFGGETPKQYCRIGSRSVLEWTLAAFVGRGEILGTVIALAAQDPWWAELEFPGKAGVHTVTGGRERVDSVRSALAGLPAAAQDDDFVLVHDAARPCLSHDALDRLLTGLAAHPVGGLMAVPVADTLKRADAEGLVQATADRTGLWQAQTPQMFRLGLLRVAIDAALASGRASTITDESSAIEAAGHRPLLVAGERRNIKITERGDLDMAERLLVHEGVA